MPFSTPPAIVHTAPVPTHAIHFRNRRRSPSTSSIFFFTDPPSSSDEATTVAGTHGTCCLPPPGGLASFGYTDRICGGSIRKAGQVSRGINGWRTDSYERRCLDRLSRPPCRVSTPRSITLMGEHLFDVRFD